jgi:hypothetical protein
MEELNDVWFILNFHFEQSRCVPSKLFLAMSLSTVTGIRALFSVPSATDSTSLCAKRNIGINATSATND